MKAVVASALLLVACERDACIEERAPPETRGELRRVVEKITLTWKEAVKGPNRAALPESCKAAYDAVEPMAKGWGCEW
jgi:hypothetical protein